MREIRGDAKTVRQLLGAAKYNIDYYQREFKWQTKQVVELIDDLANMFLESYESEDDRKKVAEYGHYFLGSIIISDKDGHKFIIDGQQRLTSLTLLLIRLHHLLQEPEQKGQVAELIFSQKYGKKSFNLDVTERVACMEALYSGDAFDENDQPESIRNIIARYADIEEHLPTELQGEVLPYFVDWLIENVHFVEITAYSDDDAYMIFETMNDRGLSLTPTDMLKGYLLAHITDVEQRNSASRAWKNRIRALSELGKDEDADGIKSWLRSQHAESIRERKRGAAPRDFDLIGTEFHRWVREHEESLGLKSSSDFAKIIERDFAFYGYWYERLRLAGETLTQGLQYIHYNARQNFTLQYAVLLAPLQIGDSEDVIQRKMRVAAAYLDIMIHRRIWNWRAIDYSTMQYAMFVIMREIRGRSAGEVATLLRKRLDDEQETFSGNDHFRLHGMNRRQIHHILARITDYVETSSGQQSRYVEYVQRGKNSYEVEHILADHPDRYKEEFGHPADFAEHRNRIGALLLLPKSFNASYGDLTYEDKLPHYNTQNLLARSLHPQCYDRNPGFLHFMQDSGLPFKAYPQFNKAEIEERSKLYRMLAERIWDPEILIREAGA